MKILGICCSPREGMATRYALDKCLAAVKNGYPEIHTEVIDLSSVKVGGCLVCGQCMEGLECSQKDDFNGLIHHLTDARLAGLIVSTPVYFGSMSSQCKAFLDRCVMFRRNGFLLRDKVGGVIAVGGFKNGGQEIAIQSVQAAMLVQDMIIVGDGQPGAHFGGALWSGHPEGVEEDIQGLETVRNLGRRVAEVALKLNG